MVNSLGTRSCRLTEQKGCRRPTRYLRGGVTLTELLVAAMMLVTGISLLVTLAVRTGRLCLDSQHYELALDELTNQLEQLTTLSQDQRTAALATLAPSAEATRGLPHPRLSGREIIDQDGQRILLEIAWDRRGPAKPVTLVSWVPTDERQLARGEDAQ